MLPAATLAEMRTPAAPPGDEAWAGGYGLGLAIAQRAIQAHGGEITPPQPPGGGLGITILPPLWGKGSTPRPTVSSTAAAGGNPRAG